MSCSIWWDALQQSRVGGFGFGDRDARGFQACDLKFGFGLHGTGSLRRRFRKRCCAMQRRTYSAPIAGRYSSGLV